MIFCKHNCCAAPSSLTSHLDDLDHLQIDEDFSLQSSSILLTADLNCCRRWTMPGSRSSCRRRTRTRSGGTMRTRGGRRGTPCWRAPWGGGGRAPSKFLDKWYCLWRLTLLFLVWKHYPTQPPCHGWKYLKALDVLDDNDNVDAEVLAESVSDMLNNEFSKSVSEILETCGERLAAGGSQLCPPPEVMICSLHACWPWPWNLPGTSWGAGEVPEPVSGQRGVSI